MSDRDKLGNKRLIADAKEFKFDPNAKGFVFKPKSRLTPAPGPPAGGGPIIPTGMLGGGVPPMPMGMLRGGVPPVQGHQPFYGGFTQQQQQMMMINMQQQQQWFQQQRRRQQLAAMGQQGSTQRGAHVYPATMVHPDQQQMMSLAFSHPYGTMRPQREAATDNLGEKLLNACVHGKTAEAERLIGMGAPVDWQDEHGYAPLHGASEYGHTEIVVLLAELMRKLKCDLNVTGKYGNTPLIWAAWGKSNILVARELVWSLCDLEIRNKAGKTAAEVAKEEGIDALAEYLASQAPREQAEIRADPSRKEALRKKYQSQAERAEQERLGKKLWIACFHGSTAEVMWLIAEGAPVDWQDEHGWAPLHYASWNGNTEIVVLLAELKCNLNVTDKYGNTPLIYAANKKGKREKGAWLNAAYKNYIPVARELVWSLCDLEIRNKAGKTAAEVAKEKGHDAFAEYLASQAPREQAEIRADPSRKEALRKKYQSQAEQAEQERLGKKLWIACLSGQTAEVMWLIAGGAPVDWQTGDGNAPLHTASRHGHTEIVILLLENKCNMNVTTMYGYTPLISAAENNHMDTVRALVEAGCDITIRGNGNKTAAEWAKQMGHHAIAEYLNEIRFHSSARNERGQLHHIKGRGKRSVNRDLKEIAGFDDHMLHKLAQFCTGRR